MSSERVNIRTNQEPEQDGKSPTVYIARCQQENTAMVRFVNVILN